jgi:hypothetical protein
MTASAQCTPIRQLSLLADASFEEVSIVGFNGTQAGVEQVTLGDDDHVEPGGDFVATKGLSNQSLSSISLNGSAELAGRCDPQPADPALVGQDEDRAVAAVESNTSLVDLLELRATADVLGWMEFQSYSLLTVSFFRPLARRRFSTRRPFFVLMRTRNPCVLAR